MKRRVLSLFEKLRSFPFDFDQILCQDLDTSRTSNVSFRTHCDNRLIFFMDKLFPFMKGKEDGVW